MDESSRAGNAPSEDIQPLANSGRGPLQVPGFGGIPIHYELPPDARFAHGNEEWRQAPAVTARELAMLAMMNQITDHHDWHVHVFNDEIVAQWRDEAFQVTKLMSEKAWDWCVEELRDKAAYFRENQHIRVLEAGSCVCKSDTPSLQSLSALFREAVPSLLKPQHMSQNLDRRSDQVLSLVDPSLFPLVHGRSLVFINGGEVDLDDIFGSYKDSMVAPSHYDRRVDSLMLQRDIEKHGPLPTGHSTDTTRHEVYRWSPNYQRLPCEVEFLGDSGTEIRVTSYINNLHPLHKGLYHAIEKLISLAIKPWNDCLIKGQRGFDDLRNCGQLGPVPLRIITYGIEWDNELPEWALAFRVPSETRKRDISRTQRSCTEQHSRSIKERQEEARPSANTPSQFYRCCRERGHGVTSSRFGPMAEG